MPSTPTPNTETETKREPPLDISLALALMIAENGRVSASTWAQSDRLFEQYGSIGRLLAAPPDEMARYIPWSAVQRLAAVRSLMIHQLLDENVSQTSLRDPEKTASYLCAKYGWEEQEQMGVLLLDTHNQLIAEKVVYRGNISTIPIRAGELFRPAIVHNAPKIILWHNHPSGNATPSPQDEEATVDLRKASDLLNIALLDHLVIGRNAYVSMQAENLGGFS